MTEFTPVHARRLHSLQQTSIRPAATHSTAGFTSAPRKQLVAHPAAREQLHVQFGRGREANWIPHVDSGIPEKVSFSKANA